MNQTQSGMTDSTGNSTMGAAVVNARPAQGEPVMAKGDTLRKAKEGYTK